MEKNLKSIFSEYKEQNIVSKIETCSKCRNLLLDSISLIPDSPHKRFKYAHYQNLVYRLALGVDAKTYKDKKNIKSGGILANLCDKELTKCSNLFINASISILLGDSFVETKNKLKECLK